MMSKGAEAALGTRGRRNWLVLPAILFSLGCGGPKGDVSGKVTYQGKPLLGGTVTFFAADNKVVGSSPISADGDYSIAKVPTGEVKITVSAPPFVIGGPNAPPPFMGKATGKPNPQLTKERAMKSQSLPRVQIPGKYKIPEQSGLTYTVQSGKQEYSIDLK
jgi:hypothetical protein